MATQLEHAQALKNLHIKGDPLIVFNIWDAGSAQALQEIGTKVIATGSWSVAAAHGAVDEEKLPLDLVLGNLRRIVASVDLPVSLDFEGGYAQRPAELQATVAQVIEAGAAGINFEDQIVGGEGLYSVEDQCARIAAVRQAAEQLSLPLFINARTDIFLKTDRTSHSDRHLEEAAQRAHAYAEAGANGFFAPGLRDSGRIQQLCDTSPLPVNIMVLPDTPSPKRLAELGVARISYGPGPYQQVMDALKEAGRKALSMN